MGGVTLIALLDHRDELEESIGGCRVEEIVSGPKQVEGYACLSHLSSSSLLSAGIVMETGRKL